MTLSNASSFISQKQSLKATLNRRLIPGNVLFHFEPLAGQVYCCDMSTIPEPPANQKLSLEKSDCRLPGQHV
jgi:hypothetical protein